jgi:hypothetical protein
MEELRDSSIHHTAMKFCDDVKQMKIYGNLYKTVQVKVLREENFQNFPEMPIKFFFHSRNSHARRMCRKMT